MRFSRWEMGMLLKCDESSLPLQGATGEPQVPLAELPPLAGPNARDCTPSKRGINPQELLPGTPQTAPPPGVIRHTGISIEAQHHMMSPPVKRQSATCFKGASAGLMSPPPARTRGAKLRQSGSRGEPVLAGQYIAARSCCRHNSASTNFPVQHWLIRGAALITNTAFLTAIPCAVADGADDFTFSPAPKGLSLDTSRLFSPAGAFNNQQTPVKAADGEQSIVNAMTPAIKPNKLFGTPLAAATPQQTTSSRPTDRHSTPAAAEACSKAAASGIKARKLTFEGTASSTSIAEAKRKTKSGITFELGDSAMAVSTAASTQYVLLARFPAVSAARIWQVEGLVAAECNMLACFGDVTWHDLLGFPRRLALDGHLACAGCSCCSTCLM